jgi:hypothetical protein
MALVTQHAKFRPAAPSLFAVLTAMGMEDILPFWGIQCGESFCHLYTQGERIQLLSSMWNAYDSMAGLVLSHYGLPLADRPERLSSRVGRFVVDRAVPGKGVLVNIPNASVSLNPGAPDPECYRRAEITVTVAGAPELWVLEWATTTDAPHLSPLQVDFKLESVEILGTNPTLRTKDVRIKLSCWAWELLEAVPPSATVESPGLYRNEISLTLGFFEPSNKAIEVRYDNLPCQTGNCPERKEGEVCIVEFPSDVWEVNSNGTSGCRCVCHPFPDHYELDVLQRGHWSPSFNEGVASLTNSLLPQKLCGCSEISKMRWELDNGINHQTGKDYIAAAGGLYNNPLGPPTPGALRAWRLIQSRFNESGMLRA